MKHACQSTITPSLPLDRYGEPSIRPHAARNAVRRRLTHIAQRAALTPCAMGLLAASASGQSVLHLFDGQSPLDQLGYSASGAGDVNGDGYADVIAGAKFDDNNGTDSGSALVFSGFDGSLLYQFNGDAPGDLLGGHFSVGGGGDANADGFDDLIAASYDADTSGADAGRVRVYSGADGSLLWEVDGDAAGDRLGFAVSFVGDVNGDAFDDLIAAAVGSDNSGVDAGSAKVLSGLDGALIYEFNGDSAGDAFGWFVDGVGDVNMDGRDDMAVAALSDDNNGVDSGSVRVLSGADGTILYTFDGDSSASPLAICSGAGDLDGDGHADLLLGFGNDDTVGIDAGRVDVRSGADGSLLQTFWGDLAGDGFGSYPDAAGDLNGDGTADIIVGAIFGNAGGSNTGYARAFSGADWSVLFTVPGESSGDWLGHPSRGIGDTNGDGFDDLLLASRREGNNGSLSGSVRIVSGREVAGTRYCGPAQLNSAGLSGVLFAAGSPSAAANALTLVATSLPPQSFGFFLTSQTQGAFANIGGSQGTLCLGGAIGRYVGPGQIKSSGAAGQFALALDLTSTPTPLGLVTVLPMETWNFQAWHRDAVGGAATSNFTDAVSVTFQ